MKRLLSVVAQNSIQHIAPSVADSGAEANARSETLTPNGGIGEGGEIVFDRGVHTVDTKIDWLDGVEFQGATIRATSLKADDSYTDEALIHAHPSSTVYFGGLEELRLDGNKSQTSTRGLRHDNHEGDKYNDVHIDGAIFRDFDQEGMLLEDNIWGWRIEDVLVEGSGANADFAAAELHLNQCYLENIFVAVNPARGLRLHGPNPTNTVISNLNLRGNDEGGGLITAQGYTIIGLIVTKNGVASTNTYDGLDVSDNHNTILGGFFDGELVSRYGCILKGNSNTVGFCEFQNHATADLRINNDSNTLACCHFHGDVEVAGNDNYFHQCEVDGAISNTGARTRWNGVIGGGPLGGTDIGSLTGANAGDVAMAGGTTATNADTLWILKSNGDWQRVDGGATITPA